MMGAVSGAGGHFIDKYNSTLGRAGEIAASAILGGTVDELGGGKFANGAITSAFSTMFNDMMHPQGEDVPDMTKESVYQKDKPLEPVYPEIYLLLGGGRALFDGIVDGLAKITLETSSNVVYTYKRRTLKFTKHGMEQAELRGFTKSDIMNIIKRGTRQLANGRHGPQYKFKLHHNTVVVDKKSNKLITVFSDKRNIPGKPDGYIYK